MLVLNDHQNNTPKKTEVLSLSECHSNCTKCSISACFGKRTAVSEKAILSQVKKIIIMGINLIQIELIIWRIKTLQQPCF